MNLKGKSVFSAFTELMERNKYVKYGVYGLAAAIALILFLTPRGFASCVKSGNSNAASKQNGEQNAPELPAEQLEARLGKILSEIRGAGKVNVMITYENTSEIICAAENESSESETDSSAFSRPAKITENGNESPIVLTELQPKIRGVIVIAEGAANFSVKTNLMLAVSTVLGIDQSRVEVFEMKPKK